MNDIEQSTFYGSLAIIVLGIVFALTGPRRKKLVDAILGRVFPKNKK